MKFPILLGFITVACAGRTYRNPLENPDLYQGDILGIESKEDRNALPDETQLWPKGVIYYKLDLAVDYFRKDIERAMKYIEGRTCIEFIECILPVKNYIKIINGDGCYSYWGMWGGAQPVSLGDGCQDQGTIIHELMHAIGFDHEQNRSDRDDYLEIFYENINPDNVDQFQKLKPHQNRLINNFDYESIMMYGETAFSIDGRQKTMKAKKQGVRLLDTNDKLPSESDMYRVNWLYKCEENRYL